MKVRDQAFELRGVIDDDGNAPCAIELGNAGELGLPHLRCGQQQAADAGRGEHLRFRDRGASNSGSAGLDLERSDFSGFVRLRVWPQRHPRSLRLERHSFDVALERRKIEHQCGGLDGMQRIAIG